jgi:hypothetical protein
MAAPAEIPTFKLVLGASLFPHLPLARLESSQALEQRADMPTHSPLPTLVAPVFPRRLLHFIALVQLLELNLPQSVTVERERPPSSSVYVLLLSSTLYSN